MDKLNGNNSLLRSKRLYDNGRLRKAADFIAWKKKSDEIQKKIEDLKK